ncbi:MAG: YtxH domain-containing protein [Anaerolineales bacterium]
MKKKTASDINEQSDANTTRTRRKTKKAGVGKVVTGFVVGSVVGATVGLLLAPASG